MSRRSVWKTKDKEEIRIGTMDDGHVLSLRRFLERLAKQHTGTREMYFGDGWWVDVEVCGMEIEVNGREIWQWMLDLDREIKRRGLKFTYNGEPWKYQGQGGIDLREH